MPKTSTEKPAAHADDANMVLTFPVFDMAEIAPLEETSLTVVHIHDTVADAMHLLEEKVDVIELSSAATQRLAAMNQLAAANLGMTSCNAMALGTTIETAANDITERVRTVRDGSAAQADAAAAMMQMAQAAAYQLGELSTATEMLRGVSADLRAQIAPQRHASGSDDPIEKANELADRTWVAATDVNARIRALATDLQRLAEHGCDFQEHARALCGQAIAADDAGDDLRRGKALMASLTAQIDIMIPPIRQIANSCTSITTNLTMSAEGLINVRDRIVNIQNPVSSVRSGRNTRRRK